MPDLRPTGGSPPLAASNALGIRWISGEWSSPSSPSGSAPAASFWHLGGESGFDARLLGAALDGVALNPEQTNDDAAPMPDAIAEEESRDREFDANRPPHHEG